MGEEAVRLDVTNTILLHFFPTFTHNHTFVTDLFCKQVYVTTLKSKGNKNPENSISPIPVGKTRLINTRSSNKSEIKKREMLQHKKSLDRCGYYDDTRFYCRFFL